MGSGGGWRQDLEQQIGEASARAEAEVKRVVAYLNDEVVPEVRREGSKALRSAGEQLLKLAEQMERGRRSGQTPPAGTSGGVDDMGL